MINNSIRKLNQRLYPKHILAPPEWLVLGVNNVCNLHCKMCDVGTGNLDSNFAQNLVGTHPLHMPESLFFRIIDQVSRYYPTAKLGYAFTEPLVYKYLDTTLAYAKEKNRYTSITTNALTLQRKAQMLCENKLNEINISLDGTPEIHNEIRGHKSSFEKAILGIEELLKHKAAPEISIYCVITDVNTAVLHDFACYFKKYPIKNMGFMHANFTHKATADQHNLIYGKNYPATASNLDEFDPKKVNLNELHEQIQKIKADTFNFPISFSPELTTMERLTDYYLHPEKLFGKVCNDVFRNIMIKSDGTVIPSHGRCYNIPVGNIYSQNLRQIWNAKPLATFRQKLMASGGLMPACSRCCSAF